MDLGIAGRVALVGGGSRGIGHATSIQLSREGVRVVVAARSPQSVQDTVNVIEQEGGVAAGLQADMATLAGIQEAVRKAVDAFGPPDILVTNVYPSDAPHRLTFEEADDDAFDVDMHRMIMSIVWATREVLPHMKAQRWGRLINIGSGIVRGLHAPPTTMVLSNITRLGAVGLMKTLAFDLGRYNITANTIATGHIRTERADAFFLGQGTTVQAVEQEMAAAPYPLGVPRMGRPEELAALITFLCSEHASYVSGEVIGVNGGKVLSPGL